MGSVQMRVALSVTDSVEWSWTVTPALPKNTQRNNSVVTSMGKEKGDLYCWRTRATVGRAGTNKKHKKTTPMVLRQRGLCGRHSYLCLYLTNLKLFQLHFPAEAKTCCLLTLCWEGREHAITPYREKLQGLLSLWMERD